MSTQLKLVTTALTTVAALALPALASAAPAPLSVHEYKSISIGNVWDADPNPADNDMIFPIPIDIPNFAALNVGLPDLTSDLRGGFGAHASGWAGFYVDPGNAYIDVYATALTKTIINGQTSYPFWVSGSAGYRNNQPHWNFTISLFGGESYFSEKWDTTLAWSYAREFGLGDGCFGQGAYQKDILGQSFYMDYGFCNSSSARFEVNVSPTSARLDTRAHGAARFYLNAYVNGQPRGNGTLSIFEDELVGNASVRYTNYTICHDVKLSNTLKNVLKGAVAVNLPIVGHKELVRSDGLGDRTDVFFKRAGGGWQCYETTIPRLPF